MLREEINASGNVIIARGNDVCAVQRAYPTGVDANGNVIAGIDGVPCPGQRVYIVESPSFDGKRFFRTSSHALEFAARFVDDTRTRITSSCVHSNGVWQARMYYTPTGSRRIRWHKGLGWAMRYP